MADEESPIEIQERIAQQIASLADQDWERVAMTLESVGEAFQSTIVYWTAEGNEFFPKSRGNLIYDFKKLKDATSHDQRGKFKFVHFQMRSDGSYTFDYKY
jgi:outer membrane protease